MVAELSARHALSNQIVDGVAERTGGVPLFIEEVTRLLLERGEQGGTQTWVIVKSSRKDHIRTQTLSINEIDVICFLVNVVFSKSSCPA
jgi:hypothetical protein